MERKLEQNILQKLKQRKLKRFWSRLVSVMMCVVVFCTTYALILPAITKEADTFCGVEEHMHTSDCYPEQGELICDFAHTEIHTHTEDCHPMTEALPSCGLDEVAAHKHTDACMAQDAKTLCCTIEETEGHAHTDACQPSEEKVLCCTVAETEGHVHTEACQPSEEKIICCTMEETEGHIHTDTCIQTEKVLICSPDETQEHVHEDSCYTDVASYICGMQEVAAHTHTDACYTVFVSYGCGMEEIAEHVHMDECYITTAISYGCGLEEAAAHTHGDACYTTADVCTLPETEGHTHSDSCYRTIYECGLDAQEHIHTESCYAPPALICELEEHEHTLACYSNPAADLESPSAWEATLPDTLTGIYTEDLLTVARSQLGYTESSRNYIVDDSGKLKGYTRYGDWYGIPHGDWCAMFASFCLHYAGVEEFPLEASCPKWEEILREKNLYKDPSEYIPKAADLIFFDWNENDILDHVGIVEEVVDTDVIVIEGNSNDCVEKNKYELHDSRIAGYGVLNGFQPPVIEDFVQPEGIVIPENADAWAVLVDPNRQVVQAPQTEPRDEPEAGTYGLRKTSDTQSLARAGTPLDLTPFINTVTMYDEFGNIIPSGSAVTEGDLVEFKIEYTVTGQQLGVMNGETVTVKSDTLTYKLPEIFEVIRDDSGDIVNSTGQKVGIYEINSTNGMITMSFTEDYVKQNANGIQIHGNISFFSTITKITDADNENQNYEFKDGIVLGVVIEEKEDVVGDLSIEKQKVSVEGEEIVYEVKVTSTEGTKGTITITDTMSEGLTFKEGISVKKANGTQVNNAQFNAAADKRSFTLTLPEMAAGDSYIVRYRCAADIDLLGADMTVRNTASVTGKDSQNHELKDEITVDHVFEVLKKTGKANDDGTITWTITVNQAKADISGWVLEDIIGSTPYTGTVTITGSTGNVVSRNAKLPYTFPANSKDTYTITYTTSHDYGAGNTVYNKAILKDGNTEVNAVTGVGIGSPITKTGTAGELFQDKNGKYILPITWTVTIDTSGGEIPAGEFFYDKMEGYPSNDMYMTYDQLMAALENIEAEIIRTSGAEAEWFEAAVFQPGSGHGKIYGVLDMWDNVDNCQSFVYERFTVLLNQPIPKGQVLTFTYETYGVFDNNIVAGSVYKNRFNISEQYEVEAEVDYTSGAVKATKYAISYFNPDTQKEQDWFWSTIHWEGKEGTTELEYKNLHDSYLAWTIELSTPLDYWGEGNIVLREDLPEGVTVKGLALPFNSDVPTAPLRLWDMESGKTYKWEFPLYTAEQYFNWDFRNGTPVTITIKVTNDGDLEFTIPGIIFKTMAQYATLQNTQLPENQQLEEWYGYLNIFTQIDEDFAWTPDAEGSLVYVNTFENRFTMEDENGKVIDVGSQSQVITKDESEGVIRKEAAADSNNIIRYAVVLNAYGRDLIEHAEALSIHDELSYTATDAQPLRLRLVPGSVKLYEIDVKSDGSYTKSKELTANYSYGETSSEKNSITTWVHTIDLNVPDGKALLLEYAYKANGTENIKYDVFNTCTINGVGEGGLDGDNKLELEVKKSSAQADTKGIMIYKVDAESDGIFLEKARFNIYIWNEEQNKYIIVHHPENGSSDFVTDYNGMIVLDGATMGNDQFAYNTAYYIVEVESPEGYYLTSEPYYFQIVHEDTVAHPSCLPPGFVGHALTSGDIIYRKNVSDTTEISVEKYWRDYGGKTVTVTGEEVSSVTLELWQMIQGDPSSAKLHDTYTMTPDENGNWSITITDLPKAIKKNDGTKGTNYLYYIKEVAVNGYSLESSENNDGINSGRIKLVNRQQEGYELPETGGSGIALYTIAGLLLMLTSAAYLMYRNLFARREDMKFSPK